MFLENIHPIRNIGSEPVVLEIIIPGELTELGDTISVLVFSENTCAGCGDILRDYPKGSIITPKMDGFAKSTH